MDAIMKHTESGVMVMKDGMAWGTVYEDGKVTEYGWVDPVFAKIHDPRYCHEPVDVTYKGSHSVKELSTGTLVLVTRVVEVFL